MTDIGLLGPPRLRSEATERSEGSLTALFDQGLSLEHMLAVVGLLGRLEGGWIRIITFPFRRFLSAGRWSWVRMDRWCRVLHGRHGRESTS